MTIHHVSRQDIILVYSVHGFVYVLATCEERQ